MIRILVLCLATLAPLHTTIACPPPDLSSVPPWAEHLARIEVRSPYILRARVTGIARISIDGVPLSSRFRDIPSLSVMEILKGNARYLPGIYRSNLVAAGFTNGCDSTSPLVTDSDYLLFISSSGELLLNLKEPDEIDPDVRALLDRVMDEYN